MRVERASASLFFARRRGKRNAHGTQSGFSRWRKRLEARALGAREMAGGLSRNNRGAEIVACLSRICHLFAHPAFRFSSTILTFSLSEAVVVYNLFKPSFWHISLALSADLPLWSFFAIPYVRKSIFSTHRTSPSHVCDVLQILGHLECPSSDHHQLLKEPREPTKASRR